MSDKYFDDRFSREQAIYDAYDRRMEKIRSDHRRKVRAINREYWCRVGLVLFVTLVPFLATYLIAWWKQ